MNKSEYAGAEWLREQRRDIAPSPLGEEVAEAMGEIWQGLYHLPPHSIEKTKWDDPYVICVNIRGSLATTDFNQLTRLVFIAHDRCLRLEICPSGPGLLRLMWHKRQRGGGVSKDHPTIEGALEKWRKYHPEKT